MHGHQYFVYIVTNHSNNVLYTGMSSNIVKRVWEHKEHVYKGFSSKYACGKLVHYEEYQWVHDAIAREKQIKAGSRKKKIALIEIDNPEWRDLSEGWYDDSSFS